MCKCLTMSSYQMHYSNKIKNNSNAFYLLYFIAFHSLHLNVLLNTWNILLYNLILCTRSKLRGCYNSIRNNALNALINQRRRRFETKESFPGINS